MTGYTAVRAALVKHINDNFPTDKPAIPIFYENSTTINLDATPGVFVRIVVDFNDALQSDIDLDEIGGIKPGQQVFGDLSVFIGAKSGKGMVAIFDLADYFNNLLAFEAFPQVQVGVPQIRRTLGAQGWTVVEQVFPFQFFTKW